VQLSVRASQTANNSGSTVDDLKLKLLKLIFSLSATEKLPLFLGKCVCVCASQSGAICGSLSCLAFWLAG